MEVNFKPHGTYTEFTVNTSVPAWIKLEVSKSKPNANGQLVTVDGWIKTGVMTNLWNGALSYLQAQTTYACVVTATDAMNNTVTQPCSFTTLTRSVNVSFDQIYIQDDSDGGTEGQGDLDFYFFVNGGQIGHLDGTWGTGAHIPLSGISSTVSPSADTVTLTLTGIDNDDADAGGLCSKTAFYYISTHAGSDSCADWSTVEQKFTFPTGPGEVWSTAVNVQTYNGVAFWVPLEFEVNVTISVTYT